MIWEAHYFYSSETLIFQIGFRRFKPIVYDIVVPWYYRLLNGAWPILLCIFLIASCCTQILLCFGRDKVSNQITMFLYLFELGSEIYHENFNLHMI